MKKKKKKKQPKTKNGKEKTKTNLEIYMFQIVVFIAGKCCQMQQSFLIYGFWWKRLIENISQLFDMGTSVNIFVINSGDIVTIV